MTATFINVPLPQDLYSQLESVAQRLEKSAETLLTETLQMIVSTNHHALYQIQPEGELSEEIRQDIDSLAKVSDIVQLQQISASEMPLARQEAMDALLDLQRIRVLDDQEEAELEKLRQEYGHIMLRKARSFSLLAQQGHPLPVY